MIIAGRPTKGYNNIENQFYQIRLELDNAYVILKNNIDSFNLKFDAEKNDVVSKREKFDILVRKKHKEYLESGEDGETANSLAKSDASDELQIHPYWFEDRDWNLDLLQKHSIDGYHKSSIIMIYSQIEYFFIKLCEELKVEINSQLVLKDLAGYGIIGTCLVYLEKVVGIKINERLKDKFLIYQKIRNNIIHDNSSIIEVEGKQIKQVLSQFEGAYIEDENRYYINNISIFEQFKKDTENFIESIEGEVEKQIGFKTILKRMRTGFGNPLFDRKNETVEVVGDKFIYSCIIYRLTKREASQKLTITVQKASNARRILDDKKSTYAIANKEEFLKVFENTADSVLKIFKHYKALIKGKDSYRYTMVVELIF
jgi:hypothetical protein